MSNGHGGARIRSGPPPVEGSRTSERKGYKLMALPAEGFDGDVPDFPLPRRKVYAKQWNDAGKQVQIFDAAETRRVAKREAEFWAWLWSTPQACAWSMPSQAWRQPNVAMYVRKFVLNESGEATAADTGAMLRLADEIGMTDAGLARNGWKIANDELAEKRPAPAERPKRERRLRAADAQ